MADETSGYNRRWFERLWLPLSLSALLLAGSAYYLYWKTWHPAESGVVWPAGNYVAMLKATSIADIGQFVSGIAGTLVFIWIIFTYSAQRDELALQREEMAAQRKEFEKLASEAHSQSGMLEQTAAVNKRDAFLRYLELRERQLAWDIFHILRAIASETQHHNRLDRAVTAYEKGDRDTFFMILASQMIQGNDVNFIRRVDNVMTGRMLLRKFVKDAQTLANDGKEADEKRVYDLCTNSHWFRTAELVASVLEKYQDRKN
jgi:hypothetical protein